MDRTKLSRILAVPAAVVLGIGVSACNGNRTSSQARGHEGAPINITGCLQEGSGMNSFVLTQVNEPTRSVGTSGSSDTQPGVVAQEQMREAKHAYRLDGDNDQLGNLVGKKVKVEGTIADASDLKERADENRTRPDKPADIDTGDLAKVNVRSISAVADSCGSASDQPKR